MSIPPAPLTPTVSHLQLHSSVVGSVFIGTSTSIGTRQLKILYLGSSLRLFFKRVWVTQGLLYILLGVALDKTPSTKKWKFTIGRLNLSILNPSSLILTKLQKSQTLFNSFEKDVSLWSKQRGRKLDSRDALVGKAINSLQPPSILQEMDQHCRQSKRPTPTTVAQFQVSST